MSEPYLPRHVGPWSGLTPMSRPRYGDRARSTRYVLRTCLKEFLRISGREQEILTAHSRLAQATPSPRLMAGRMLRQSGHAARACATDVGSVLALVFGERIPAFALELYGPRGLRLLLNIATALLVLALPLTAAAQSQLTTANDQPIVAAQVSTYASEDSTARVTTAARGLVAGSRSPVTVAAND